jgi:hypothetical protein
LDVQNVLVAFPGLKEHEAMRGLRVAVQHRLMERRLVAHRVEHAVQELKELLAPFRHDLELDQIGDGHENDSGLLRRKMAPDQRAVDNLEGKKKQRNLTCEVMVMAIVRAMVDETSPAMAARADR